MISKYFIERPIFANVIAIITVIVGAVALFNLPVAQYPDIVPPTIQVTTRYPGASAEVIARTVGIPIEQAVNGVEDSIYMSSTSGSDGSYTLTVTFQVGTDLNTSLSLVQNMVNGSLAQLPEVVQLQGVTVRKVNTDILMVISLYSDDDRYDPTFLTNYCIINLQNPLARLPGVGQVKPVGAGPYSIRVWLDPKKLKDFKLTTLDVVNAVKRQNIQVVAGQLGAPPVPENQSMQFTINALGRLADVKQFEDIIIRSIRGEAAQIVRVRDVAKVELSEQYFMYFCTLTGHKAAHMLIYSLPGANAVAVAAEMKKQIAKMSKDFPEGLKYAIRYDTTKFVNQAIDSVYDTLFIAGVLVLLVIMVFLQNWRATLVPATTIPVTIIGAFAAMAMLGFSVNLMTLFAIILAIGIVVDDAIVIVENSSYHVEKGLSPKDAAIKAMQELTGPVMGITLVLTAIFIPAAFMPGITGQLFRQFALVIASTAIISAMNALTLKPAQCALYLKPIVKKEPNWFYRGFNKSYQAVENTYMDLVARMVKHPRRMVVVFFIIIALAGWGFATHPTGFLPDEDQGFCILSGKLPEGASQPRNRKVTKMVDKVLKETPGVDSWVTIGGFSMLDGACVSNAFSTFVVYKDWNKRGRKQSQKNIIAHLNRELSRIQEASVFTMIPPPIRGLGSASGFQMMVEDRASLGLTELAKAVNELCNAANSQKELRQVVTTFSARSPQLYLDIDRVKAESLNIKLSDVFTTLQAYLGSAFVNLFNKFNQVFQVYVQADARYRLTPDDIKSLYVRNDKGQMVPLGTLIEITRMLGSELVTRYNLYPSAAVYGSSAPGFSSGQALKLMEEVAEKNLPRGVKYNWTATAYQEIKVGAQAYFIYALSIILVFLVLAALYESWTSPAAVILVVPMALVGVYIALLIRGFDTNIYTQVGLVLMIALSSKNAILIVEFARALRAEGMSIEKAAVEGTRRRFRAVIMTSFAFILGVMPLMWAGGAGAASQRAIGTVVFGGMLSSTLIALPFVPVFYVVMQQMSERKKK
ncbi:efflux RND transporter permease subunit [Candidatus Auribacterota bacterium]